MATVANVQWRVAETWRIDATMHDSCGVVLSLVDAEVFWRLALNGTTIATLSIGNGIEIVGDGALGECLITFTPQDQEDADIVSTFYTHECQVVLPDGTVTDQFAGNVEALPSLFPFPS